MDTINDQAIANSQPGLSDPVSTASPAASGGEPSAQGSINQPGAVQQAPTAESSHDPIEVANLRKGMNEAQRKAAELQKRLRDVEPFVDEFARNPQFRDYMYEHARNYGQQAETAIDPSVTRVLDPMYAELRQTREEVASWKYGQQMEQLASEYPDVMNAEAKAMLSADAIGTGNYDLEYHFLKRFGRQLIAKSKQQATQEAVRTIQQNNQVYAQGVGVTGAVAPAQVPDFSKMSADEKQAFIDKEVDRIVTDPDYRARVNAEIGG